MAEKDKFFLRGAYIMKFYSEFYKGKKESEKQTQVQTHG